ncbi:stage II sporulation protein M [Candidatus Woesearchaeota archaeon]|nr:stage II sporulation protein M [Candidatus Woesearchaeota archaeon]
MVLESLVNPIKAEKNPLSMFIYGFIFASISIILALLIFKEEASMVSVFLTVMITTPLMYSTMRFEESKDMKMRDERALLRHHWKALKFLIFLFFGFIVAYSLWFVFLPPSTTQILFHTQLNTISSINSKISGNLLVNSGILLRIFINNFKVMLFCLFFSLFFGAGAIFILTWNASVIGAAMGSFATERLGLFGSHLIGIPLSLMRYMTHGVFEILAYFMAGLAGGIISVAIINNDLMGENKKRILRDSVDLILLSIVFLIVGSIIEVFVTPLFF